MDSTGVLFAWLFLLALIYNVIVEIVRYNKKRK